VFKPNLLSVRGKVLIPDLSVRTICWMTIDFDPIKNERNIRERGLSFERAAEVDFNRALVCADTRKAYGEARYVALCYLDRRLHVLCFTETLTGIRVISFRKANAREADRHGKAQVLD